MSRLTAKERRSLPAGDFAGPDRSFPMNDTAHIEAAVREEKFASPSTRSRINARAKDAGFHPRSKPTEVA